MCKKNIWNQWWILKSWKSLKNVINTIYLLYLLQKPTLYFGTHKAIPGNHPGYLSFFLLHNKIENIFYFIKNLFISFKIIIYYCIIVTSSGFLGRYHLLYKLFYKQCNRYSNAKLGNKFRDKMMKAKNIRKPLCYITIDNFKNKRSINIVILPQLNR